MTIFLFLETLEGGLPQAIIDRLPAAVKTALADLRSGWNALTDRERRVKKYQIWKECYPERSEGFPTVAEYEELLDQMEGPG